jgi:hypothetical protein
VKQQRDNRAAEVLGIDRELKSTAVNALVVEVVVEKVLSLLSVADKVSVCSQLNEVKL